MDIDIVHMYLDFEERLRFGFDYSDYIAKLKPKPDIIISDFIYQRVMFYRLWNSGYSMPIMIEISKYIWDENIFNKFTWYLLYKSIHNISKQKKN